MSTDRKTIPKPLLPKPTTNEEAVSNVFEAILFAEAFLIHATKWKDGNKSAGLRARSCLNMLRKNASTINQSMIFLDKRG